MSEFGPRVPLINEIYEQYLVAQDSVALIQRIGEHYDVATLERLARGGSRVTRRAAVLALGFVGEYDSNHILGLALRDNDRAVRTIAENSIRNVWCRAGSAMQRERLGVIMRLNAAQQLEESVELSTELIEKAPWFAEAWNQRAVAYFALGRYGEAIKDCHQALEINPYHFGAASCEGRCYLELDDSAEALVAFRRALNLNPGLEAIRAHVVYLERSLKRDR
ncbi:MAG: tetratricopeptide repeat protein [Pirellulales bacterium]|nr:tetratricopeptide repeat protein [Pirellulales bacterium]